MIFYKKCDMHEVRPGTVVLTKSSKVKVPAGRVGIVIVHPSSRNKRLFCGFDGSHFVSGKGSTLVIPICVLPGRIDNAHWIKDDEEI